MQSGDKVANLSIATSETWKDKATGERKEKTEWHRVVVFNPGIVKVCENYLQKGSKVYIEGELQTRKWADQASGQDKYSTEVVLRPYRGELTMLDSRNSGGGASAAGGDTGFGAPQSSNDGFGTPQAGGATQVEDLDDEIPF
jgi:single-strand DNA-binding protein